MKLIKERTTETKTYYTRGFTWKEDEQSGFSFDCTKEGKMLNDNKSALDNYNKCIAGEYEVNDLGIVENKESYRSPAIGICDKCNSKVELINNTNTCDKCETDYNMFGQQLAPRNQWGYETGEHWTECL